jgi:hypothetical protein
VHGTGHFLVPGIGIIGTETAFDAPALRLTADAFSRYPKRPIAVTKEVATQPCWAAKIDRSDQAGEYAKGRSAGELRSGDIMRKFLWGTFQLSIVGWVLYMSHESIERGESKLNIVLLMSIVLAWVVTCLLTLAGDALRAWRQKLIGGVGADDSGERADVRRDWRPRVFCGPRIIAGKDAD